jgi:hypothetical protein
MHFDRLLNELVQGKVDCLVLTGTEETCLFDSEVSSGLALGVDEALWQIDSLVVCNGPNIVFWIENLLCWLCISTVSIASFTISSWFCFLGLLFLFWELLILNVILINELWFI